MKKILTTILVYLLLHTTAWATTWYVRDGGTTYGTSSTTCNGQTNAVYTTNGGPNCAVSNINYLLGWLDCNGSGTGCTYAGVVSGSDTIDIDGDSDTSPGSQAVYEIGYTSPQMTGCSSGDTHGCILGGVPAGTSGNPTIVQGTGSRMPKLLGLNEPYQIFFADNNYITLSNLEITDNSSCTYVAPTNSCTYEDGIYLGGTNLTLSNIYVHGLTRFGINTTNIGNSTFTNLWAIGNGFGGMTIGNGSSVAVTGTLTFNQPIIEWNGCQESYPLGHAGIDNPLNYSNCYGQASGGYGDGLAFGPSGNTNAGNWTVYGPGSISFNTQDGYDTLHGNGNGTMQIDKMRFEGNAGQQVKINALNAYITNSVIIGDCGWWYQATQSATGAMQPGDACRANGDTVLFNVTNGSTAEIYNNTIISNGSVALESTDGQSTGCNGSTAIHVYNNIVNAGYYWGDDTTWNGSGGNSLATYLYNDGNNGDGGGTCGTLTWDENYNIVYNAKNSNQNCVGSHDKCGTVPGFAAGSFLTGTAGGGRTSYYTGQAGSTLIPLGSSSAAIAAGESGLFFWDNSNDFYNVSRPSPPSMGAEELDSCAANAYGCQFNSDCCGNNCSNNICGGSCTTNGGTCSTGSTCCSGICSLSTCIACIGSGYSCSSNASCCSGDCSGSVCVIPTIPFSCKLSGNSKITGNSSF